MTEAGSTSPATDLGDYDSSVVCSDAALNVVASNASDSTVSVGVDYGDEITCTITNSRLPQIKVVKTWCPTRDTGTFDLTIDATTYDNGGAGYGDNGTPASTRSTTGSHTVAELGHTGTSLAKYSSKVDCDSGKGAANPGTSNTFSVAYGDKVTCTITNTAQRGQADREEDLVPASDTARFDLKIDDDGTTTAAPATATADYRLREACDQATHTVSRGRPQPGHRPRRLRPLGRMLRLALRASRATPGTRHVSVGVDYGDEITCTITNSRLPQIKVVKDLVPDTDPGLFDLSIDATSYDNGGAGYGDNGTTGFHNVTTGSHSVAELGHTGTSLSKYSSKVYCDSGKGSTNPGTSKTFSVAYGDKVTCTITNTRNKGKLTVKKTLVPAIDSGRFDLKIETTVVKANAGDGGSGFQMLDPGTYSVSEAGSTSPATDLGDYDRSVVCRDAALNVVASNASDSTVSVGVDSGDDITCTITNSRLPQIKVVKDLVPDTDPGLFDLSIDATSYDNGGAGYGDNGTTGFHNVTTGSHSVAELGHTGTSLSKYSSKVYCDSGKGSTNPGTSKTFSVAYGDKVTCTITNTRNKGKLTVKKTLVPAIDSGRFDLKIETTVVKANAGDGGSGFQMLDPGTYSVSEAAGTHELRRPSFRTTTDQSYARTPEERPSLAMSPGLRSASPWIPMTTSPVPSRTSGGRCSSSRK